MADNGGRARGDSRSAGVEDASSWADAAASGVQMARESTMVIGDGNRACVDVGRRRSDRVSIHACAHVTVLAHTEGVLVLELGADHC